MRHRLGRFRILEARGADFLGSRYLAYDPKINRQVELKTLDPGNEDSEGMVRERFFQEARVAARLSHSNIIKIFGMDTEEDIPYVIMENFEGQTFQELLAAGDPLPPGLVLRLLGPIADALAYAHDEGVVHRDIQPANIIVLSGQQTVLSGFGMAKLADVVSAVTRQGIAVGTPGYASPELVTGGHADVRSDIFSLGAVIYEALTGKPAFVGRNLGETLYRIAHTEPVAPSRINPSLNKSHDRFVSRTLAKSAEDRYSEMTALLEDLEGLEGSGFEVEAAVVEPATGTGPLMEAPLPPPVASDGENDTIGEPAPPIEDGVGNDDRLTGQTVAAERTSPAAPTGGGIHVPHAGTGPTRSAAVEKTVPSSIPKSMKIGGFRAPALLGVTAALVVIVSVLLMLIYPSPWSGRSPDPAPPQAEQILRDDIDAGEEPETVSLPEEVIGESATETEESDMGKPSGDGREEPLTAEAAGEGQKTLENTGGGNTNDSEKALEAEKEDSASAVVAEIGTGTLEVECRPWARVILDGEERGNTPLRIEGVSAGEHRIALITADGRRWDREVNVVKNGSEYIFYSFPVGG